MINAGWAIRCPCCGHRARGFIDDYNRPNAKCPSCFSEERHRALRIFLDGWIPSLARPGRVLHQAPEVFLRPWLEAQTGLHYLTGDVADLRVSVRYDLEHIPLRASSLDGVIASHVLEHIDDDRAAMRELLRVLKPGGSAILLIPVDQSRDQTYEDPTITTPSERQVAYWQSDHVRLYGSDFTDRLSGIGFEVRVERPSRTLPPRQVRRFGLEVDPSVYTNFPIAPPDEIFVATRPASP